MKIIFMKEEVYTHRSLETGDVRLHRGGLIGQEAKGNGKAWATAFVVISMRKAKQDRVSRFRIG